MLKNIKNAMLSFFRDEEGQGMVEYIIIVIVIAIAAIVAFKLLGRKISGGASRAASAVSAL
ncbi:MAG: Flp family type IVb pilin [candidate division WOR-3 bacterium]